MKGTLQELKECILNSNQTQALAVLSFPAIQKMNITVKELIQDSELQRKAMEVVQEETNQLAYVSMMDLSVESESFGCKIQSGDDEVPTVVAPIARNKQDIEALVVPKVGTGRENSYIEAIRSLASTNPDKPVFAGAIGPYSLAGRLMDVSEIMVQCMMEPDMVHTLLKKACAFTKEYLLAFKAAGANGVILAEPLAGLLSPDMMKEFSSVYVAELVEALQDENFTVIYHNCGPNTIKAVDQILACNAWAYHFGNAINLEEMLKQFPEDVLVMGNVDPVNFFQTGTTQEMKEKVEAMLQTCGKYKNFILSSGCDIPPKAKWENIEVFFSTLAEHNKNK